MKREGLQFQTELRKPQKRTGQIRFKGRQFFLLKHKEERIWQGDYYTQQELDYELKNGWKICK